MSTYKSFPQKVSMSTDWKTRPNSPRANQSRVNMFRRIQCLEQQLQELREKLLARDAAIATLNKVSTELRQAMGNLAQLSEAFHGVRVTCLNLSPKEQKVYDYMTQHREMQQKEVAENLHISLQTVRFHMKAILSKTGARTRYEL